MVVRDEVKREINLLDISHCQSQSDNPIKIIEIHSQTFLLITLTQEFLPQVFLLPFKKLKLIQYSKQFKGLKEKNFRPVSLLPVVSKVYERLTYKRVSDYFEHILSKYQCCFRNRYCVQNYLLVMVDKRKKHCVKSVRIQSYSGPPFPVFRLNPERYSVSFHIQSQCGEIGTRITPNTGTFYAVKCLSK